VVPWTRCTDSCRAGAVTQVPSESSHRTRFYRRDDRRIVGVESLGSHGLAFFGIHTVLDVRRGLTVPHGKARHPQRMTGRGFDGLSERFCGGRRYSGLRRNIPPIAFCASSIAFF
jgi:hypothetical protein